MPKLRARLKSFGETIDVNLAQAYLSFCSEKRSLIVLVFHSIVPDGDLTAQGRIIPDLCTSISQLRQIFDYFLLAGYKFTSLSAIEPGVEKKDKCVLVTFDDGYANNRYALPLLKEYNIPALFFVSTRFVQESKCFWWDVVYRTRCAQGVGILDIQREISRISEQSFQYRDQWLNKEFDSGVWEPKVDIERPFTPGEIKSLALEPLISFGNHTRDHALMNYLSAEEIKSQVEGAQEDLFAMTGSLPEAIAYPAGYFNPYVLEISGQLGIKWGFTAEFKKNYSPFTKMSMGRFYFGQEIPWEKQAALFRSDVRIMPWLRRMRAIIKG